MKVDYSKDAFTHIYDLEKSTDGKKDKKKETKSEHTDGEEQQTDPTIRHIMARHIRQCRVVLERIKLRKSTVKVRHFLRRQRQKSQSREYFVVLDTPSPEEGDTSCESQKDRSVEDTGEYWTSADNDDESSRDSGKSKVKSSRKKKDSYHKKLENAFIKSNRRVKRKPDTNKLLSTLDPLHQATLSNLTNIAKNSYSDLILEDDHDCEFEDVMYKLALYSPPISDHGNMSPPQAMSPTRHYLDDVDVIIDEFPRQTRHVWAVNGSVGSPTVLEHPTDMNDTGQSESPVYAKSPGSACSGG